MSPSITEIIAQRRAQEERLAQERRNAEIRRQEQERLRILDEEVKRSIEAQRKIEEQREFAKKAERVFRNFGVIEGLEEIKRDLLSGVKKKDLLIEFDRGRAILVWGSKYTITGEYNNIDYEKSGFLGAQKVMDYSVIIVSLLKNDDLEILGQNSITIKPQNTVVLPDLPYSLERSSPLWSQKIFQFSYSKDKVKEAIADAYLSPRRVKERYVSPSTSDYSSSSSGSSNCECCCECSG